MITQKSLFSPLSFVKAMELACEITIETESEREIAQMQACPNFRINTLILTKI
jgi:hypothetical protein